jgi:hypothetical protein
MARTYPSIGRCIYCGSSRYSKEKAKLALEHIIPEGLSGVLLFQEASCQACERITGRVEAKVLRNHLLGPRWSMRLRSKTRASKRNRNIRLSALENGVERQVEIDADESPSVLLLMHLGWAPFLRAVDGQSPEVPAEVRPWHYWFAYDQQTLAEKFGVNAFLIAKLDLRCFCRMLAKIAHAYAVAAPGPESFTPFLTDMIRDKNLESRDLLAYVGCLPGMEPAELGALHSINAGTHTSPDGQRFRVVRIRLFANLGAPTYVVVVGTVGTKVVPDPKGIGDTTSRENFYALEVPLQET